MSCRYLEVQCHLSVVSLLKGTVSKFRAVSVLHRVYVLFRCLEVQCLSVVPLLGGTVSTFRVV